MEVDTVTNMVADNKNNWGVIEPPILADEWCEPPLVFGGSKRLPRWFGAFIKRRTIQPFKMVNMARKKVPQSARLSAGGSNRYLGSAQMKGLRN